MRKFEKILLIIAIVLLIAAPFSATISYKFGVGVLGILCYSLAIAPNEYNRIYNPEGDAPVRFIGFGLLGVALSYIALM